MTRLLAERPDVEIRLFGTACERLRRVITAEVAAGSSTRRESSTWPGKPALPDYCRELTRCAVLACNDTGGMHLANMLGVPVVAVFGPTNPVRTGPIFEADAVVLRPPGCPETGGADIAGVSPDHVAAAVAPARLRKLRRWDGAVARTRSIRESSAVISHFTIHNSSSLFHSFPCTTSAKAKFFVTLAAPGFIGSALVHHLNELGYDNILVTDLLGADDKFRNLVPLKYDDYMEADDFRSRLETDPSAFADIKTVFHLGACSATTEKDARHLVHNNYEYTKWLAGWSLKNGARFVYASSAATYGDGAHGMDDKLSELHRLRPLNMYGYSKHFFDMHAGGRGYLDNIVGLKFFNVYGPANVRITRAAWSAWCTARSIRSKPRGKVKLFRSDRPDYRDGEQMRDFVYVKDAVAMAVFLAQNTSAGGLYNIGAGKARTWLDLMRAIFKALGRPENIEFIDMPPELKAKYQYFTEADISKIRAAGYDKPQYSLEDAVADYVKNHLVTGKHLGE